MAWSATDDFESYADASSLDGASGGSGWTGNWTASGGTWTVEDDVPYEGVRYVFGSPLAQDQNISRTFTAVSSGTLRVAMRRSNQTQSFIIQFKSAGGTRFHIYLDGTPNILVTDGDGANSQIVQAGYSVNTWYEIWVDFDATAGTCRAKIGEAGTYTSPVTMTDTGDITTMVFYANSANPENMLFDYIGPVTPQVGRTVSSNRTASNARTTSLNRTASSNRGSVS